MLLVVSTSIAVFLKNCNIKIHLSAKRSHICNHLLWTDASGSPWKIFILPIWWILRWWRFKWCCTCLYVTLMCCVAETSVYTNALYTSIVLWTLLKMSHNASVWGVCVNACFGYTTRRKLCCVNKYYHVSELLCSQNRTIYKHPMHLHYEDYLVTFKTQCRWMGRL